jgi:hypothetical protein
MSNSKEKKFSRIDKEEVHDFKSSFHKYVNQECSDTLKTELARKLSLAFLEFPDQSPKDLKSESVEKNEFDSTDQRSKGAKRAPLNLDEPCAVCRSDEDEENCLLCDRCDLCMHTYCVGLCYVPDGTWNCPWCDKSYTFDSQEVRSIFFRGNSWISHDACKHFPGKRSLTKFSRSSNVWKHE